MRRLVTSIFVLCCVFLYSPTWVWADDPVFWTNAVGVSVASNSLTKTDSTAAWNAGGASTNIIRDGYGYVETTVTETNTNRMIGLSNGDTDQKLYRY